MAISADLHEDFDRGDEIKGSSDRGFGLTVGGILAAIGLFRWWKVDEFNTVTIILLLMAVPLVLLGLLAPRALAPLNRAWTRLGLLLAKVTNPIFMGLIFFLTVTPIALLMRLIGKDPLKLKLDRDAESYWIERTPPGPSPESMRRQF